MNPIKKTYDVYKSIKFYIIIGGIAFVSGYLLLEILSGTYTAETAPNTFDFIIRLIIAPFGIFLPFFVIREQLATNKFFNWLELEFDNLENGVIHPDGYIVTLDTPFVRYQAVFSALVLTASFPSRPYPIDEANSKKLGYMYTLFCILFGWWFFGLAGIANTLEALNNNFGDNESQFTLRDLMSENT